MERRKRFDEARQDRSKQADGFRRVRLGQVKAVLRMRGHGYVLPDDDAGREYLYELLLLHSLHPTHPVEQMRNEIEVSAPWMSEQEGEQMTKKYLRMPEKLTVAIQEGAGRASAPDIRRARSRQGVQHPTSEPHRCGAKGTCRSEPGCAGSCGG